LSECVLEERVCDGCGECLKCDLDSQKKCNNCCACLEEQQAMRTVIIKKDEDEAQAPHSTRKVVHWNPQK
jgi:hypothetical protein